MRIHRWWLALVAALLTPWVGPHMDRYLPVGWALLQIGTDSPDPAFWFIAGFLLAVAYVAWVLLLTGLGAWLSRRRGRSKANHG